MSLMTKSVPVAAILTVCLMAGCSSAKPAAEQPVASSPAVSTTPPAATPSGPPERKPVWQTDLPGAGELENATVVGDTVVVHAAKKVAALNRADGKLLWSLPVASQTLVSVTAAVVVIEDDLLQGVDLRSGRVRYRRTTSGHGPSAAVTSDRLVVPTCGPKTCEVTGLKLPGFTRAWSYKFPRLVAKPEPAVDAPRSNLFANYFDLTDSSTVGPAEYAVLGREVPHDRTMTTLAVSNGKPVRTFSALDQRVVLAGRIGLTWTRLGSDCGSVLKGQDVSTGKLVWRQQVYTWDCHTESRFPLVEGQLIAATADQRPVLIDIATGKRRWTGPAGLTPIGLSTKTVLTRTAADAPARSLAGLDAATGRQLWQLDLSAEKLVEPDSRAAVQGDRVAYATKTNGTREVRLNDARTGAPLWTPADAGDLVGLGPNWLLTQSARSAERIQLFS